MIYVYKVVKEDYATGKRSMRTREIGKRSKLKVGGLYTNLGRGFPGTYRVLELLRGEEEDE